jgi:hypothetical protein
MTETHRRNQRDGIVTLPLRTAARPRLSLCARQNAVDFGAPCVFVPRLSWQMITLRTGNAVKKKAVFFLTDLNLQCEIPNDRSTKTTKHH